MSLSSSLSNYQLMVVFYLYYLPIYIPRQFIILFLPSCLFRRIQTYRKVARIVQTTKKCTLDPTIANILSYLHIKINISSSASYMKIKLLVY